MSKFAEDLKIQQEDHSVINRVRYMSYNSEDMNRLGELTELHLDPESNVNLEGSSLAERVDNIVAALKDSGTLPSTTVINYGNSHIVVSESKYAQDDIFAIWDRSNNVT